MLNLNFKYEFDSPARLNNAFANFWIDFRFICFGVRYGCKKQPDQTCCILPFNYCCDRGGIAYYTGEAAEETVEHIEGIVKSAVEEHEESGKIALISVITIGVLSLAGIYLTIKKSPLSKLVTIIILLCSLLCFGITMRTGYLGGLIRHTEISSEKK